MPGRYEYSSSGNTTYLTEYELSYGGTTSTITSTKSHGRVFPTLSITDDDFINDYLWINVKDAAGNGYTVMIRIHAWYGTFVGSTYDYYLASYYLDGDWDNSTYKYDYDPDNYVYYTP